MGHSHASQSGEVVKSITLPGNSFRVALHPSDDMLAVSMCDSGTGIYSSTTLELVHKLEGRSIASAFSNNGAFLARVLYEPSDIIVCAVSTWAVLGKHTDTESTRCRSVAWSPNGSLLAVSSNRHKAGLDTRLTMYIPCSLACRSRCWRWARTVR